MNAFGNYELSVILYPNLVLLYYYGIFIDPVAAKLYYIASVCFVYGPSIGDVLPDPIVSTVLKILVLSIPFSKYYYTTGPN